MNKPIKLLYKLRESELREIIKDSLSGLYGKKYSLLRLINEDYHKTLNEEYGIDFETEIATDDITGQIKNNFKVNSKTTIDENGLKNYIGNLEYTYKNVIISIKYRIINFVTEKNFDELYPLYNFNAKYESSLKTIFMTIGMYNGGFIIETFHNSLQHELSHIFDNIGNGGYSISEKEKRIYNIAVNQIKTPISELSYELANAVYISFKSEQITMCNGVDAMFRNNKNNWLFSVQQTNEYKFLFYLKKIINNIETYSELIKRLYKIAPEKMLTRLKVAYKDYIRRLSRIEIKYKE